MSAVLGATTFANVFIRANESRLGANRLASCSQLPGNEVGCNHFAKQVGPCQPVIAKSGYKYVSLTDTRRIEMTVGSKDLAIGRFRSTLPSGSNWYKGFDPGHHEPRYDGTDMGKPELEANAKLMTLLRTGSIKSVLDAGAGTCTFYAALLNRQLFSKLDRFYSFGGYNCPMLRFCGERGTISMEFNWLDPLPFCSSCKFDLVFQAQGLHHNHGEIAHM